MKNRWHFFVILIAFLYTGFLSWNVYFREYTQKDTVDIALFPKVVGDWQSEEIPIKEEDKKILETNNVFVRRYFNPLQDEVYFFVVYSQTNRKVSHPPEICYTGSGATITGAHLETIETSAGKIVVNQLKAEQMGISQIFSYWFKVGDQFVGNYWKQQLLIAWRSFLNKPASSALIRVSSNIKKDEDDQAAVKRINSFIKVVAPVLPEYLP